MDTSKIIQMYMDQHSVSAIAKAMGTYTNKIRRILIKAGITLRDKSEAQSLALKTGASKHPSKGIKKTEEQKIQISNKLHNNWLNTDEASREKRRKSARDRWANMSESEKQEFRSKGINKVLETAKEGSKIEKILVEKLLSRGYNIIHHKKYLFGDSEQEIDIMLPNEKIVIEVDGPSHFLPFYGEDKLKKRQESDKKKSGQVLNAGWSMIRLGVVLKNVSSYYEREAERIVVELIEDIKSTGAQNKYIEVLLNDDRL